MGVFVLDTVVKFLPANDFFRNPEVDLAIALYATLVLILAGTVAGLFPALKSFADPAHCCPER